MQERKRLEEAVTDDKRITALTSDLDTLFELAREGEDVNGDITRELKTFSEVLEKVETAMLLSGENDARSAIVTIHPGAGGTESQDWAEMLLRMYLRWAERLKLNTVITDRLEGEGAGIKSVTFEVNGENAYGLLQSEIGVHRLVRISPFDANARRHTSFASVWVYPVIDDKIEIEVQEKYLRVDTYRSSGAGGQHVNKTDSAVRMTYQLPGEEPVVAAVQSERSQHQNRAKAMSMLKARLYEIELKKREAVTDAMNAAKTDIGWGHQIRSYVLQPYQMVKDLRTGVETSQSDKVLDGDIDAFLQASLAQRIKGADAVGDEARE